MLKGRIAFTVGPIIVGEIPVQLRCSGETSGEDTYPISLGTARLLQSVFVSYSHQDTRIVDDLEKAYLALGLLYLRDVREQWSAELLAKIDEADIFQLCWSHQARRSPHVEQEWRYALGLAKGEFIRPLYWEKPMPKPAPELSHLHFGFYGATGGARMSSGSPILCSPVEHQPLRCNGCR